MAGKSGVNIPKLLELLRPVKDGGKGLLPSEIIKDHYDEINLDPRRTKPITKQRISQIKNDAIKKGLLPKDMKYVPPPKKEKLGKQKTQSLPKG